MKKGWILIVLVVLISLIGTHIYAGENPFAWYETVFQSKVEESEITINSGEETINEELDYIIDTNYTDSEGRISDFNILALNQVKDSILNHHNSHLFQLEKTKKDLLVEKFDDYENQKTIEINEDLSGEIEEILNNILD